MEMLKFLTQKLRQQSLNEVQPFQDPGIDDDRDSGTESDEENAELEALERAMQDREEDQENHGVPLSLSQLQGPPRCSSPSQSVTLTKRPLQQVNQLVNPDATFTTIQAQQRTDLNSYNSSFSASSSPQGSSDFERCSLDYEPDSSTEFDRHSSEEELAVINLASNNREYPEKRKWSQVNGRCSSCTESSGSSDEEVRDLLYNSNSPSNNKKGSSHTIIKPQPLIFSSSPPSRGVHRLSSRYHYSHHHHHHHHNHHHHHHHSSLSPRLYLSSRHHSHHHHSVSPRKRHRQNLSRDVSDASVLVQRPCLDFEKMQVSAPFFICIEPVMTMTSGVLG